MARFAITYIHSVSELFNDVFDRRRVTPMSISTMIERETGFAGCLRDSADQTVTLYGSRYLFSRRIIEGREYDSRADIGVLSSRF